MISLVRTLLVRNNFLFYTYEGITICSVANQEKGTALAALLLEEITDRKTTLYLSGGSTPKKLYEQLGKDEVIVPGAAGVIDERYGPKFYTNSNETMISDTGLLRYFEIRDIPFYPILQQDLNRENTAAAYDKEVRYLHATFSRSIGVLGIGSDGHTAGIAGNRSDFHNPIFTPSAKHLLVSEFDDKKGAFKQRVTMTFLGLSMLDMCLVLVLGEDKKEALKLVFQTGAEEDVPARFYKRAEVAKKTLLITDQRV